MLSEPRPRLASVSFLGPQGVFSLPMMPVPPVPHVFESGLRNYPIRNGYLEDLIRQQLEVVAHDLKMNTPPPSSSTSGELVAEMGDYFSRTAIMWAQLTEHLIKGPHMSQASLRAHERSKSESHMADLREVARIDINISRLRRIRDLSDKFSRQVQDIWWPDSATFKRDPSVLQSSVSPFCDAKLSSLSETGSFVSDSDPTQLITRKLLPENKGSTGNALSTIDVSCSDDSSDDNDEQFQSVDMEALRQRGKGTYLCPKGYKCDKGGVDKDGKLVIFDRNSSFAQHCNKHRKPWRCDVPGCPNPPKKRRFARRDGLERHKTTVKHYLVP